jgi:hypothetical protein
MSTGGMRTSTAARAAALQAALDATRDRIADTDRRTYEQVLEISDRRIGMIRLLEGIRKRMLDSAGQARREIRSAAALRRWVQFLGLWVLAGLWRRIFVLRGLLVVRIVFKWTLILFLVGWCLWWLWAFWGEVTEMIGSLFRDWSWP